MTGQFVQDEAPEHALFALDKLQMPSQFVSDKALDSEHGLYENEVQMAASRFVTVQTKRLSKSYSHHQTSDAQPTRPGRSA